jgi:DNA mismatch repair protein MutS
MQIDKITTHDLAIFHDEEEFSVFHRLNFTKTAVGKEWLRRFFMQPHGDLQKIRGTQNMLQLLQEKSAQWPTYITNGTVLVIDKFLDYELDAIPAALNRLSSLAYRLLHPSDYSMARFSVRHFADFYRGLRQLSEMLGDVALPRQLSYHIDRINLVLGEEPLARLAALDPGATLSIQETLYYAYYLRGSYKSKTLELIDVYGRLEAWYSMACAMTHFHLQFPQFVDSDEPKFSARGLYHVLIPEPVAYDLVMDPQQNFIFLTGANMAGKSTLIKAAGAAVYLAHRAWACRRNQWS